MIKNPSYKLFSVLFFLMAIVALAQDKAFQAPNYKDIERNINDQKSEYYYPNLLKRLKEKDTLMSFEQYKHLYYGYTFQKEYKPYDRAKQEEKLESFFKKEELKKADYPQIIKLSNEAIDEFPINIKLMQSLAYVYHLDGNEAMAEKTIRTMYKLLEIPFKSGDGISCDTAFHVISIDHEYLMLKLLGLERESQSLQGNCDFLAFPKDKYKLAGLYFNISKLRERALVLMSF